MQTRRIFLVAAMGIVGGIGVTLLGAEEKAAGEKSGAGAAPAESGRKVAPVLSFKVKDIHGKDLDLGSYQGKVLLLVNVASKCGLTDKQYAGLEGLYRKYREKGLEILAFPANNFGSQEPGNEAEIKKFCTGKGVSFKLFAKISVKGDDITLFTSS